MVERLVGRLLRVSLRYMLTAFCVLALHSRNAKVFNSQRTYFIEEPDRFSVVKLWGTPIQYWFLPIDIDLDCVCKALNPDMIWGVSV